VPGKTRAGGQSAARFERIREGAKKEHFKKVAEYMKSQFLGNKNLKGIIVGGPGPTKYDFIDGGYITTEVKNKIIAIKDLSYTGDFGLKELVEKSEDVLAKEEIITEKKIMTKFFELLAKKLAFHILCYFLKVFFFCPFPYPLKPGSRLSSSPSFSWHFRMCF